MSAENLCSTCFDAPGARRRLCAHADRNGDGMHWLEPGETCAEEGMLKSKLGAREETRHG